MEEGINALVQRLHASGRKAVLAFTGGGTLASAWLLTVPGGSRWLLEAVVPYAQPALDTFLGGRPSSYCSGETAQRMAERARARAAWLAPGEEVIGLGCTASLRSDRPKKGEHRIHIAVASAQPFRCSLLLQRDQRSREQEEELAARLVLDVLAEALGITPRPSLPLLPGETVERSALPPGHLANLTAGTLSLLCVEPDGQVRPDSPRPRVLLPGSFNPLHEGHLGMRRVASEWTGTTPAFELSILNVEKPALSAEEIRRRLARFAWIAPVWLTRAPTFVEKARLFPGVVFVVGSDTAARIVQPRFYGGSDEAMDTALTELRQLGCRFLVAGRLSAEGYFVGADQLAIPDAFADLFQGIPEERFRLDISSTQLRAAQG